MRFVRDTGRTLDGGRPYAVWILEGAKEYGDFCTYGTSRFGALYYGRARLAGGAQLNAYDRHPTIKQFRTGAAARRWLLERVQRRHVRGMP